VKCSEFSSNGSAGRQLITNIPQGDILGTRNSRILIYHGSGLKKLLDSAEIRADQQKKYGMARRSLYGRMVRIQNLSRSLAARDLPQKNAV
jgi:hypothetical protein